MAFHAAAAQLKTRGFTSQRRSPHAVHRGMQDAVYRAIVGKRCGLALSLIANVVLVALLLFKTAARPPVHRCPDS